MAIYPSIEEIPSGVAVSDYFRFADHQFIQSADPSRIAVDG